MKIARFYPIVPDLQWLKRILPLGVKTVQLRIKGLPGDERDRQIREAVSAVQDFDCQLIVNDYWRQAIDYGAACIHLGQEDLAEADLKAIRRADIALGVSSHDHAELETALRADADYIALGPIFETKLKKMKWSPQGLDRIGEWKSKIDCPLVAIGGLTVERARDVLAAGADSLAVVTDFITHPDPENRIHEWLKVVNERPVR